MISQKLPFAISINNFAEGKIADNQQRQGQKYPCHIVAVSGAIVTVAFDVDTGGVLTIPQVTCPVIGSEYIRLPIQVGDKGFCISADTVLGGVSGLGSGLAPLEEPSNLGGLVFVPIGNKNWSSVDANAVTIYGPNGVVLRDTASGAVVTITPTEISLAQGSASITLTGGNVTINGTNVTINGRNFLAHEHKNVQVGSANSGGVV